jgi:hypothetical protein
MAAVRGADAPFTVLARRHPGEAVKIIITRSDGSSTTVTATRDKLPGG